MKAALKLLLGRADTGKSARIVEELRACAQAGRRGVLIVPEQYTFESERALCGALGGLMGVQVLSFERLSERVLASCGRVKPFLSAQGVRMVTRRIVEQHTGELTVLRAAAGQAGFAEQLQEIFGECKRAGISPEALRLACDKLPPDTALHDKLHDVALLYEATQAFLDARYLDADDAFTEAVRLLPESFLAGATVCIDGLERPNKQLSSMLEQILCCAERVVISLRVCAATDDDAPLFDSERALADSIVNMAQKRGATIQIEQLITQGNSCAAALRHMERNLYAYPAKVYEAQVDGIRIIGASSRRAEAEALASNVWRAARAGVRYREMAIVVSDMDAYASLIRRSFKRRGIPLFLDGKRPLILHAAADALLSAVKSVANGYAAADFLQYAKCGYAGLDESDIETLENYLARTGLRGSALIKPFSRANVPEAAERARAQITSQLLPLAEGLKNASVEEQARALYDFMERIALGEQLTSRAAELQSMGRAAEAEEHAQVWNEIVTLLEQMAAILGDTKPGRKGFLKLLEEGLGALSVGVIPGTNDQVLVGDLARTKSRAVSALFVVGANDGLLPRVRTDDGLFDDTELDALKTVGTELRPRTAALSDMDRLDLYTAFSKARRSLTISCSYGDAGGELSPSPLIARLQALFPACLIESDLTRENALPDCEAEALNMLASSLRAYHAGGECPKLLPALWERFTSNVQTRPLALRLMEAGRTRYRNATLGEDAARALYGASIPMNASRIEAFSSCPFKHFMRYGLRAAETKTYTERASDLGSFYHAALERFVSAVDERGCKWHKLTDDEALSLLDELLPEVVAAHNDGIFLTNDRLRATLFLILDVVRQSALAILHQVQAGGFTPIGAEVRFGENCAFPPIRLETKGGGTALLGGVVDRIDRARVNGADCIRVIDYKTGGRRFSFAGVLSGLTLQLPLYLMALAGTRRSAGLYYMPVNAPGVSDSEEDIENSLADAFKLQGLTLSEPEIIEASDRGAKEGSRVLGGVKRSKDGAYVGSVCTAREMDLLTKAALQASERGLERMLDGEYAATPLSLSSGSDACKYCDYRTVCRFDDSLPGCGARLAAKIKQSDFFELLKGGQSDEMDE